MKSKETGLEPNFNVGIDEPTLIQAGGDQHRVDMARWHESQQKKLATKEFDLSDIRVEDSRR